MDGREKGVDRRMGVNGHGRFERVDREGVVEVNMRVTATDDAVYQCQSLRCSYTAHILPVLPVFYPFGRTKDAVRQSEC